MNNACKCFRCESDLALDLADARENDAALSHNEAPRLHPKVKLPPTMVIKYIFMDRKGQHWGIWCEFGSDNSRQTPNPAAEGQDEL